MSASSYHLINAASLSLHEACGFRRVAYLEAHGDETALDIACGRGHQLAQLEKLLRSHEEAGTVTEPEYYEAQSKFDALNHPEVEAKGKKMLRGLGYKEEDWCRPASELSGGWVMRAHLAHLLVLEPDLLLLDEPTNHLDLMSLLWFRQYLKNYPGAILIISHDRDFMDNVVTSLLVLEGDGVVSEHAGGYSDWVAQRGRAGQRREDGHQLWRQQDPLPLAGPGRQAGPQPHQAARTGREAPRSVAADQRSNDRDRGRGQARPDLRMDHAVFRVINALPGGHTIQTNQGFSHVT
mgnify:CR=1 FL=1